VSLLVHLRSQGDVRFRARIGADALVLGVCRWLSLKPDTGLCPQEAAAGKRLAFALTFSPHVNGKRDLVTLH
jgi:hypothetical protein